MNAESESELNFPAEDVAELDAWTLEETDYQFDEIRLGQLDER